MHDAPHLEQVAFPPLVTSPLAHAPGREFGALRTLGLTAQMWIRNFVPFTLVVVALCVPAILWILEAGPSQVRTVDDFVGYFLLPLCVTVGLSALLAPLLMYRVIRQLEGTWAPLATSMRVGLRGVPPVLIMAGVWCVLSLIPLGGIASVVFLICVWFVAAPAAVAEALGPVAAFRRSAELTRGRRWHILGLHFLISGVLAVGSVIWIFFAIDSLLSEAASFKRLAILSAIGASVVYIFRGLTEAVSYVLLRREKEGVSGCVDPTQVATAIARPPRRPADRGPGDASTSQSASPDESRATARLT